VIELQWWDVLYNGWESVEFSVSFIPTTIHVFNAAVIIAVVVVVPVLVPVIMVVSLFLPLSSLFLFNKWLLPCCH
jgi:hypothetical protein